ncbi:unnamed protein product [Fusarium graminearum]|nr:unnamed protein product [Fusarium graminearum]
MSGKHKKKRYVSQFRSELPMSSPQIEDGSPQNAGDARDGRGLAEGEVLGQRTLQGGQRGIS